jgi:hypothetical protein
MLVESITTAEGAGIRDGRDYPCRAGPRRSGGSQVRNSHFMRLSQIALKYKF